MYVRGIGESLTPYLLCNEFLTARKKAAYFEGRGVRIAEISGLFEFLLTFKLYVLINCIITLTHTVRIFMERCIAQCGTRPKHISVQLARVET